MNNLGAVFAFKFPSMGCMNLGAKETLRTSHMIRQPLVSNDIQLF